MPCQVVCVRGDGPVNVEGHDNMRWKAGMPVLVFPLHEWNLGREVDPSTSDKFFIVTILDRDVDEMKVIIERSEIDREQTNPHLREWRFFLDSMPLRIRRRIDATGRCDISMDQIRKHVRHQRSGEAL
jgi:hypothetical protein